MIEAQSDEELVRRAQEFYEKQLKPKLEPEHNGEYIVIDVDSREYTFDRSIDVAHQLMDAKGSTGPLVCLRIGYPFTYDFVGRQ